MKQDLMKRRALALLLAALLLVLLSGCGAAAPAAPAPTEALVLVTETPAPANGGLTLIPAESSAPAPVEPSEASNALSESSPEAGEAPDAPEEPLREDGSYTSPEDVALYLRTYGRLPGNFITKNAARDLGWDSGKGNLWDVAPGKSIGGDRFGNYEGLLPKGRYRECDVNYSGGYRGSERLIYGEDGSIYYTADHYKSFTQLWEGGKSS